MIEYFLVRHGQKWVWPIWSLDYWLRRWIPNQGVLCSKPLGVSKVNSAFHPSEVDKMSTRDFWELGSKKWTASSKWHKPWGSWTTSIKRGDTDSIKFNSSSEIYWAWWRDSKNDCLKNWANGIDWFFSCWYKLN